MTVAEPMTTADRVQRQYEVLPYPHRNPADDEKLLFVTGLDDLGAVNFYCHGGRRKIQKGFRALVAGGGTGDAVMFLARQLRETDASITYMDLSDASLKVAQARARYSGMQDRITWRKNSLLDLPTLGLGEFDYINCSGVLHHLEDPLAGLKALKSVLKPDGSIGLMLYAQCGRTGVYQMQDLLRGLCRDVKDPAVMVQRARAVLDSLPQSNWFRRSTDLFPLAMDDAELFDLLLHARDRAFTITQVHELVDQAGLSFAQHTCDQRALYEASLAFTDPELRTAIAQLSPLEQQAAAEMFWGATTKHTFWVTPSPSLPTNLSDPDNVPFFSRRGLRVNVRESILAAEGKQWVHTLPHNGGIKVTLRLQVVPAVKRLIELIDDRKTMGEIVKTIASEYDPVPPESDVWKTCLFVFNTLLRSDYVYLRHRTVDGFVTA